jgi:cytochrome c2
MRHGVLLLALAGTGLLILSLVPAPGGSVSESASAPAASAGDPAAYGRALFSAKGCPACHTHNQVNPGSGVAVGPVLSNRAMDPAFLREWLKDPPAVRPGTQMPNLRLSEAEIEALIVFLVPGSD